MLTREICACPQVQFSLWRLSKIFLIVNIEISCICVLPHFGHKSATAATELLANFNTSFLHTFHTFLKVIFAKLFKIPAWKFYNANGI